MFAAGLRNAPHKTGVIFEIAVTISLVNKRVNGRFCTGSAIAISFCIMVEAYGVTNFVGYNL